MDIAKLIDFLQQYPAWYRSLLGLWLIVSAVLAGGLIVLKSDLRPAQSPGVTVAPPSVQPTIVPVPILTASSPPLSVPIEKVLTAQAYFTTLRSVSDRFLEKQEFIERISGREVEWEGLVDGVSQRSSYVSLSLTVEDIRPERTMYVSLPESLRTKAFSLQKGDLVRVKGKLSLSTPNMPDLDAIVLTLVRPRSAS